MPFWKGRPEKYLEMVDRQVLLRFAQRDSELFYSAWDRYKELLIRLPEHGLSKDEDMADYDNWCWNHSPNNQGWEENSNFLEPWDDTQPQQAESSLDLEVLVA
ncbi:hypothetical protein L484_017035 [Morus notabilis]|uniref:Uncharacterized protein n=1 Tax=Morus notabilis TaxID=981085 RepID=W9SAF3_9ROSA|nr:hypothetical protein L484_017035 [Morus notabilis]